MRQVMDEDALIGAPASCSVRGSESQRARSKAVGFNVFVQVVAVLEGPVSGAFARRKLYLRSVRVHASPRLSYLSESHTQIPATREFYNGRPSQRALQLCGGCKHKLLQFCSR
jgi:hypothetical protein